MACGEVGIEEAEDDDAVLFESPEAGLPDLSIPVFTLRSRASILRATVDGRLRAFWS